MSSTDKYNFAKTNHLKRIPAKLIGFTDDELNTNIEDTSTASKGTAISDFYNKGNKLDWYNGTVETRTNLPFYNQALSLFKTYTATSVVEVGYEIELKSGTISSMNDLLEFENAATITQWYINGYAESEANVRKCINAGGQHSFSVRLNAAYAGKISLIETNSFSINLFRDWYFEQPIQGYERVEIHNRNPDKAIQKKLEAYTPDFEGCTKFLKYFLVKDSLVSGGEVVDYKFTKDLHNKGLAVPEITTVDSSELTGTATLTLYSDDTKVTTLATGITAINTWLQNNDSTNTVLTVSGAPTGNDGVVTIDITDYGHVSSPCGSFKIRGFAYGNAYFVPESINNVGGKVNSWLDLKGGASLIQNQAFLGLPNALTSGADFTATGAKPMQWDKPLFTDIQGTIVIAYSKLSTTDNGIIGQYFNNVNNRFYVFFNTFLNTIKVQVGGTVISFPFVNVNGENILVIQKVVGGWRVRINNEAWQTLTLANTIDNRELTIGGYGNRTSMSTVTFDGIIYSSQMWLTNPSDSEIQNAIEMQATLAGITL